MSTTYTVNNIAYPCITGTSGATLSYTNGTTASWTQPNSHFTSSNGNPVMTIPHGGDKVIIEEKAALEVKGKMKLNGLDLEERLNVIEQVLNIPTRDVTIENKYPKLAELYQQYMHELEKYKTFERLKGDDNERTTS